MMFTNFWIKGWMAWVVKAAILAVLAAAALRAQPSFAASASLGAASLGPAEPGKAVYLAVTQSLGLTLDNHMQTMGNLVAWATRDSIRFGEVVWGCPLGFCSVCSPAFHSLPGIALPGPKPSAPPPFGLAPARLRTTKIDLYDVQIAFVMPNGVFYHHVAGLPSSSSAVWSVTTETRTVALKTGESPRMVAIGGNPADMFRSTLFLGGTGRLLLMAGWSDTDGLSEFTKDPFTTISPLPEDLVSSGGGFFGGSAGGVMGWQYDVQPTHEQTGMQSAARAVDGTGAMGDDGWIAMREGATWKAFRLTPGDYRDFRFVRDGRGLGVLRYPPTGAPVYTHLRESPTRFASIETMGGPIDFDPPDLKRMTLLPGPNAGIKAVVADSESNFTALRIELVEAAGDTLRLGREFTGSDTAGGCVGPGICVQPGKPYLEIRSDADSLYVTMTVQAGYVDGACFRLISRTDSAWRAVAPWKRGSRLSVFAGRGVLVLEYGTTGLGRLEPGGRLTGPGSEGAVGSLAAAMRDANGRRIPGAQSGATGGAAVRRFPLRR
jgi:hypothetical protein